MRSTAVIGLAVLFAAPAALAQERGNVLSPQAAAENQAIQMKRFAEIAARVPLEVPVKGAPYSADVIVGTSQTLADGNHISHSETSHVYRDGEGRTRREQNGNMTVAVAGERVSTRGTITSIVDPVAGYSYSLDAEHKIAWRTPIGASKELLDKLQAAAGQLQPGARGRSAQPLTEEQKTKVAEEIAKMKAEADTQTAGAKEAKANAVMARGGGWIAYAYEPQTPLEHATIAGLAVEGRKSSETIPAGKIGNELPITITSEEWTSTDLKVLVLTKHNDPRTGESTYRLANIVRAEPDASLFIVPPDYTVKDTGIKRNNE